MLKKIFSNTLAQLVAKFFGAGLTLLTTYFTIRLAGLELYGDLTRILVLVAVGFTAIDFGLNAEGIRSYNSRVEMQSHLSTIIMARFVLSIIAIIILNIAVQFLPGGYSDSVKKVFFLGSLAIIFQGFYTSSNTWFQYHLSYWRSTISVVVGSIVGSGLTLYFLFTGSSLENLVLSTFFGYFAMAITSYLLLPSLIWSKSQLLQIYPLIRRSLVLGLILIASVIASKMDTILLGIFRLSSEVGEYGFAYRIFDVVLVLPVFVMNAVYPLSLQKVDASSRDSLISRTTWALAGIGAVAGCLLYLSSPLIDLIKPGMDISIKVLKILSFALPLFYLTAPLMWGLIARKKDKIVLGIYLFAAVLNTILNLIFIPSYGAVSAAINTIITEFIIFIALLYFSHL